MRSTVSAANINGIRSNHSISGGTCLAYGLRLAQVSIGIDTLDGGEITYAGLVPTLRPQVSAKCLTYGAAHLPRSSEHVSVLVNLTVESQLPTGLRLTICSTPAYYPVAHSVRRSVRLSRRRRFPDHERRAKINWVRPPLSIQLLAKLEIMA